MYKLSQKFGYEFANRTPGYEFPSWVGLRVVVYEFANNLCTSSPIGRGYELAKLGTSWPQILVRVRQSWYELTSFWYEFAKVGTSWPKILVRVRQSWYELTSNFGTSSPKLVRVRQSWYELTSNFGTSSPKLVRLDVGKLVPMFGYLVPMVGYLVHTFLITIILCISHICDIFLHILIVLILKYHNKAKFSGSKIYCIW